MIAYNKNGKTNIKERINVRYAPISTLAVKCFVESGDENEKGRL